MLMKSNGKIERLKTKDKHEVAVPAYNGDDGKFRSRSTDHSSGHVGACGGKDCVEPTESTRIVGWIFTECVKKSRLERH